MTLSWRGGAVCEQRLRLSLLKNTRVTHLQGHWIKLKQESDQEHHLTFVVLHQKTLNSLRVTVKEV